MTATGVGSAVTQKLPRVASAVIRDARGGQHRRIMPAIRSCPIEGCLLRSGDERSQENISFRCVLFITHGIIHTEHITRGTGGRELNHHPRSMRFRNHIITCCSGRDGSRKQNENDYQNETEIESESEKRGGNRSKQPRKTQSCMSCNFINENDNDYQSRKAIQRFSPFSTPCRSGHRMAILWLHDIA